MITDIILRFLYLVASAITSPIRSQADVSFDDSYTQAAATAWGYVSSMDSLIPLSTLFVALSLILTVEFAIFVYKGIMWTLKKIPGIS